MLSITNKMLLYIIGIIIYKGSIIINVSNLFTKQIQNIHKIFIDIILIMWYYIITTREQHKKLNDESLANITKTEYKVCAK
jgi:hypothetical protein